MKIIHRVTAAEYLLIYSVRLQAQSVRLDHFLKNQGLPRSRAQIQRAIHTGAIELKRSPEKKHLLLGKVLPSTLLASGDEVWVKSKRKEEPPVSFEYRVVYEDETLLVIDKPPDLPVHPAGRYFFHTLLTHLQQEPQRASMELYLVHRIDRETSGLLVLAKNASACAHLVSQFAERQVHKKYLALVHGSCPESFEVDHPLDHKPDSPIGLKMFPLKEGPPAFTQFHRLALFTTERGTFSLVECFPKTGRQHQIRAHLDLAGYPIVGDKLYGLPEEKALLFYQRENQETLEKLESSLLLPRHALHATELSFIHPKTKEKKIFYSPLPEDLRFFLREESKS